MCTDLFECVHIIYFTLKIVLIVFLISLTESKMQVIQGEPDN